jgi:hypothetical protein
MDRTCRKGRINSVSRCDARLAHAQFTSAQQSQQSYATGSVGRRSAYRLVNTDHKESFQ